MKTKPFLSVLFFLISILPLIAQTPPDTVFTKLFHSDKLESYPTQVIEANGGGMILLVNANDTRSTDTSVINLFKVDENGVKEWTAQIAAEDSALWPYAIVATHEADGYIITGVTVGMESSGTYDYFILKTNNSGSVIWKNVYGVEDYDDLTTDIIKTDDGNYLVLGATQDAEPEPGWHLKFFSMKINGAGTTLWYKTYGNNENYSTPSKIAKTADGYILSGYSLYNETFAFLVKINNSGDSLFTKTFPAEDYQHTWINDIAVSGNGDFFLIGNVTNTISPELYDIVLMKLDANCNLKWTKTYDFFLGFGETGISICTGNNSSLYFAGACNIDELSAVSDVYIMKTDTSGNEIWKKELADYETVNLKDMLKTGDDLYICGTIDIRVESFPYLTKFKVENSGPEIIPTVFSNSQVLISNLTENTVKITILLSKQNNANIEIFDIGGHKVYGTQTSLFSSKNEIYIQNLTNGLYICRCAIGDDIIIKKFLVFGL
jgi:hypothetical protein